VSHRLQRVCCCAASRCSQDHVVRDKGGLLASLGTLTVLHTLDLQGCEGLTALPAWLGALSRACGLATEHVSSSTSRKLLCSLAFWAHCLSPWGHTPQETAPTRSFEVQHVVSPSEEG
jgi:hypothetical protein